MSRYHVDVRSSTRTSLIGTYFIPLLLKRKLPLAKLEIATRQQTRKFFQLAATERFGPRRRSVLAVQILISQWSTPK